MCKVIYHGNVHKLLAGIGMSEHAVSCIFMVETLQIPNVYSTFCIKFVYGISVVSG